VTVEEELNKLDDDIRRLKIEYDVYFSGGTPRPPHDTLSRVETVIKRYSSDQSKLSFGQRFRFSSILQKYSVNRQLWQRKLQDKEEGRGQFAVQKRAAEAPTDDGSVRVVCSDPDLEKEKVDHLLRAMREARIQTGETSSGLDPAAFHKFIKDKTEQVKQALGCDKVQFSVAVENGKVKFKATKAE
jgi:hypothetical protein